MKQGLPQGTVLGPLPINLLFDDLKNSVKFYTKMYSTEMKIEYCAITTIWELANIGQKISELSHRWTFCDQEKCELTTDEPLMEFFKIYYDPSLRFTGTPFRIFLLVATKVTAEF